MHCVLARTLLTSRSPSGLTFITDEQLYELLADMQQWQDGLPEHLKFRGPDTSREGGECPHTFNCMHLIRSNRVIAPALLMRVHDVLARIYADKLLVPGAPQVRADRRAVDGAREDDGRVD